MESSVFQLVTHLCQELCNDFNKRRVYGPPLGEKAVRKYRNEAFEILLRQGMGDRRGSRLNVKDSVREFQFHQFDMRRRAKTALDRDRCDQLEICIEKLLAENEFFRTDSGQSILMLLLLLKNSTDCNAVASVMDFYPFGFFSSMRSCTETNPYILMSDEMCLIPHKLDVDVENQYRQFNPYMPNPLIFVAPTDPKYQKVDYFFKLNYELSSPLSRPPLKAIESVFVEPEDKDHELKEEPEETTKGQPSLSWRNLGESKVDPEKPFLTETNSAMFHLMNLLKKDHKYSLKVVAEQYYLMNLKYLCSGVQSDSFQFDEDDVSFRVREENVTVKNVASETLEELNNMFIEFGTCFRRLELASNVIPEALTLPVEGFVYKALSKAVNQFLFSIRHFIFNGPKDETLLQFSLRMRPFARIIGFFGRLFNVHPEDNRVVEMPKGSRLLIYLYEILMDEMNKQDMVIPVITIIRDCCQAYYQLFQQWVFNGILIDPHEELFINYTEQYQIQTKYYFDKSFFLRSSEVPAFLKGYEQDVLLCGKYTMLLREYKPNHRIFSITCPPRIHVCLSHEGIERLKKFCNEYLKNGYEFCGGRISVKEIFAEMRERKNKLKQSVWMRFQENLQKWHEEVKQKKIALLAEKKKRLDELQKQIDEKQSNDLERRKVEIELEKECEAYDHKLEEMELQRVAEERKKRIEYYEELNEIANVKRGVIGQVVSGLEQTLEQLRSGRTPDAETYNANYKLQMEKNLDLLNANSEQFSKNKTKVLGSELANMLDERLVVDVPKAITKASTDNLTEAQRNKLKVLSEEFDLKNYENCDNKEQAIVEMGKKILTDAQKNKLKVMAHEFNNNNTEPVDEDEVVLVERESSELTPLEKNRVTAMSHHLTDNYFKSVVNEPEKEKEDSPEILTERQKNRMKVLSHEFGITFPGEEKKDAGEVSDLQKNRRRILSGNVTSGEEPKPRLTLDLNAQLSDRERNKRKFMQSEWAQSMVSSANLQVTNVPSPMSMTSDPADLGDVKEVVVKGEIVEEEEEFQEIVNLENKEEEDELQELPKSSPPLDTSTFMDFLKPIISTGVPNVFDENPTKVDEVTEEGESSWRVELQKSDLKRLSTLNFETVNQLLQQSLTIPLRAQLELMNNEILKVYLLDLDIYSHFKSLRNHFFMMDGEFGIHICEGLISNLEGGTRPSDLYSCQLLNSTLEQAFGASIQGKDKNGGRFSFALNKNVATSDFNLLSPNVLEDLELLYEVEWPLNLILCPKAIHQYSTVFQYLLKVRRISWVLENSTYMSLKASNKMLGRQLLISPQFRHVQLIRHKFSQFVNCLKNHISSSAIQSSWKRFKDDLQTVTSMADLYNRHSAYIKQIRFLCMLNRTSQEFQARLNDIFTIILRFNSHLNSVPEDQRWQARGEGKKRVFVHQNYEGMCRDEEDFDKCCNYVMYLGQKIVRRGYQVELNEFLNLVNMNGFYKGVPRSTSTGDSSGGDGRRKK